MVVEELRNVKNCVSGPETHVYACLKSSITVFWFRKQNYKVFLFYQNMVGEDLRHAKTWVSVPQTHAYACLRSSTTIFWFKETKYFINYYFLKEIWLAKNWDMHKCAFQALKCTFMHTSGLPPPKFDLISNTL